MVLINSIPLYAQSIKTTNISDLSHVPYTNDGYIEAYQFSHIQQDLRIYIVYLVSNIGPGILNNGIAVLIYENNQSQIFTAEYSKRSFSAQKNKPGIKSGVISSVIKTPFRVLSGSETISPTLSQLSASGAGIKRSSFFAAISIVSFIGHSLIR